MLLLYVDDDQEDQQIFCEAAATIDAGIECIGVKSGKEAIDILSKISHLPDFIFTDINMPRMGGKEFLKYLKTHSQYNQIPVIVISTGLHNDDRDEFMRLGAKEIVSKPTSFNDLISIIKTALRR